MMNTILTVQQHVPVTELGYLGIGNWDKVINRLLPIKYLDGSSCKENVNIHHIFIHHGRTTNNDLRLIYRKNKRPGTSRT